MKIAIVSRNESLYSTNRLIEAATQRGHEIKVIDILKCYMNITPGHPSIHVSGHDMKQFDAVIPRIGTSQTFYGCSVIRQFETMGTYSLNPSLAISRSRDKLRSLQLLARKSLPMPITVFANSPNDIDDLIKMVGGAPLVIKLLEGTQGVGVVLAETQQAAQSVIQAFYGVRANIVIQEYIQEAKGCDIRCIVLGGKVIASMKRQAPEGEFRSNLHRGGSATTVSITKAERNIAIQAAKIMGLNFAGVDLIRSKRGPLIMEVNSSPGLRGIETATGKDIASQVIAFIESNAKPITKKTRYEG